MLMSGDWHFPDYISVEGDASQHPDIIAIVPPLPNAVTTRQWEEIAMIHGPEHLTREDGLMLFRECYTCLAPGGELIMECPDISFCAAAILGLVETPPEEFPGQFGIYGILGGGGGESKNPFMWHRSGYTPSSLTALLIEAGFDPALVRVETAVYHQPVRDFRVVGVKGKDI
jgi:hypothetical protein